MAAKRPMVAFLTQLLLAIRSRFTRRVRLEDENLLLRQQLVVLRRKSPTRVRLWNIDRLLLVWLYRLYPSLLDAMIIVQPETVLRCGTYSRRPAITIRTSRRISRIAFSASSECRSTFDLISAPSAVKMSQKSSLPQSLQSVQLVLTGNTRLR
jgi:hypothetical protein